MSGREPAMLVRDADRSDISHRDFTRFAAASIVLSGCAVPGYSSSLRAVWLSVPESFLEERRLLGQVKKDELWDGELHMVSPPSSRHGLLMLDLLDALVPIARRLGLRRVPASVGLYGPGENWRNPEDKHEHPEDNTTQRDKQAELVIEVLSPHDESYAKLPWYASRGVPEVWIVDPATRTVEIHALAGSSYRIVSGTSPRLGIRIETRPGGCLYLIDGEAEIAV